MTREGSYLTAQAQPSAPKPVLTRDQGDVAAAYTVTAVIVAGAIWGIFKMNRNATERLKKERQRRDIVAAAEDYIKDPTKESTEEAKEEAKKILDRQAEIAEEQKRKLRQADAWKERNVELIFQHRHALYEVYTNSVTEDVYGNLDFEGWSQYDDYLLVDIGDVKENVLLDRGFRRGWPYFWRNVLIEGDADAWFQGWFKYKDQYHKGDSETHWYDVTLDLIHDHAIVVVAEELDAQEAARADAGYSDDMSGQDYEVYCAELLREAGWNVELTQASNDQGVDLIASIENLKVCIQCKRYSNPVGNKAVQEVIAGKAFYNGSHAVVVSNAGFTKAATALAESAGVILISDVELDQLEMLV